LNGCRNSREQLLQASLAVQKLTLSFFTLCDVPRDFRSTDGLARRGTHRGDRERDIHEAAVLAPAYGLIVMNTFAAAKTRKDSRFFVRTVRRDQHHNGLPHRFCFGVAEQMLRGGIPGL